MCYLFGMIFFFDTYAINKHKVKTIKSKRRIIMAIIRMLFNCPQLNTIRLLCREWQPPIDVFILLTNNLACSFAMCHYLMFINGPFQQTVPSIAMDTQGFNTIGLFINGITNGRYFLLIHLLKHTIYIHISHISNRYEIKLKSVMFWKQIIS